MKKIDSGHHHSYVFLRGKQTHLKCTVLHGNLTSIIKTLIFFSFSQNLFENGVCFSNRLWLCFLGVSECFKFLFSPLGIVDLVVFFVSKLSLKIPVLSLS